MYQKWQTLESPSSTPGGDRYASTKFSVGNLILNNFCLMNRNESKCVQKSSLYHNSNKFIFIHLIFLLLIISFFKNDKERNFLTSVAKKSAKLPHKISKWADISP